MSLTFDIEPVGSTWNEVMLMANQHWLSTKSYRRHEPFNPSIDRYEQYNKAGYFQLFMARDGSKPAGYFGVYITPSMHSQQLMATEDTFFLRPEYRGGRNALRFLKHIEARLAEWGVYEVLFSCEIDNSSGIKGLLELLDYKPVIMQYSKHLQPRADSAPPDSKETEHVCAVTSTST